MKKKKAFLIWDANVEANTDRRPDLATQHERLLSYSRLLNRTDRVIFKLVSSGLHTHAEVAVLLGISVSSLSYHVTRLKMILRHDFRVAVVPSGPHSTEKQKIVRLARLKDQSLKSIASETGLSLYRVRKIIADRKQKVN